jgi:hypothetical protein
MTMTPEPPPARDDESGSDDVRFDRRIALGVVAALAVVGTVGPFGWHLLSNTVGGSSTSASAAAAAGGSGGGAGSNGNAAVASPAAATSSSSASPPPAAGSAAERASAACSGALSGANAGGGTAASVDAWVAKAAPSVSALRADSAALHVVVVSQDATTVPAAAESLCGTVSTASRLDASPDALDAASWQAALSAYVAGATDALAGASNHPAYYQAAQAQLAQGEQELDVLTARITANAHR